VTAVFRLVGVDYRQWKAVSRTLLRADFRAPLSQSGEAYSLHTFKGLLVMALVYVLVGLGASVIVIANDDVALTGTLVLTYMSFMLATAVLTHHGATMLSGEDYAVLLPRPVSSRTFLAIRLTNVLFHALLPTTFMAIPAVTAFVLAHGVNPLRGVAAAFAVYAWASALTVALAASYGALLGLVGASRLQRLLGYMQMIVGLFAYGGLFIITRMVGANQDFRNASMPDEPWPWLIPPAWFASYLEIASGSATAASWGRAALSLAAGGLLVWLLAGRLGAGYAARLSELASVTSRTPQVRRGAERWFRRGEERAVKLLVFAHFRHDVRVRMGILAIFPLLFFYMLLGVRERFDLVGLAVLLFPAMLSQHFAASDAYRASWIYAATPADRARLVIALKNIAVVYFLLPFLAFVAAMFAWRMGSLSRGLLHAVLLGLISHVALQGAVILSPRLPFAMPPNKTQGSAALFAWMFVVIFGGQGALVFLDRWVYVTTARTVAAAVVLVAAVLILDRIVALRARSTPS
jgi:hypothetical protein